MTDKIAIIDMGTNTFHLLLAEADKNGRYHIVHRDRMAVKIGKGGINNGYITEEGLHRALLAMQSLKNTIDEYGILNISAFLYLSMIVVVRRRLKIISERVPTKLVHGLKWSSGKCTARLIVEME